MKPLGNFALKQYLRTCRIEEEKIGENRSKQAPRELVCEMGWDPKPAGKRKRKKWREGSIKFSVTWLCTGFSWILLDCTVLVYYIRSSLERACGIDTALFISMDFSLGISKIQYHN